MAASSDKKNLKAALITIIVLVIINVITLGFYYFEKDQSHQLRRELDEKSQSIGVVAGKAVLDFSKKTEANYEAIQQQTEKALDELTVTGNEMLNNMNKRLDLARGEMQETAHQLLETFQEELEKFNQTLKESQAVDPASGVGSPAPSKE